MEVGAARPHYSKNVANDSQTVVLQAYNEYP